MSRFLGDFGRRSPAEWGFRAVLAIAICFVGYNAARWSTANALPVSEAKRAHELAPGNARITAEFARRQVTDLAEALAKSDQSARSAAALRRIEALAQRALKRDPTAVAAATTLGLIAQLRGDGGMARQWFDFAERLSRRDLTTELWFIEDAISREDIGDALHHYDIALRTKRTAPELLFPILTSASSDPNVAAELVKTLSAKPEWTNPFVEFVATNTTDPKGTARLFVALGRHGITIPDRVATKVVDALIAAKEFDAAWAYYTQLRPDVDRRRSREPKFAAVRERPSQFDWVLARADEGLSAGIQFSQEGGLLSFTAPPSIGGEVVRQMQLLPPGRYVIEGRSSGIEQRTASRPFWALECRSDKRELGRVPVPNSTEDGGRFSGLVTVPADCPTQVLILWARPSSEVSGLSGEIRRVQLGPAG